MTVLRIVATAGCGIVTGLLLAFSAGVMTGLARLPGDDGAAAMRSINSAVLNPVFLGVFVGTGLVCAALVVAVLVTGGPVRVAAAGIVYLVGVIGVTAVVNVPLNEALAVGGVDWTGFLARWTGWNHVRTVAGVLALGLLLVP